MSDFTAVAPPQTNISASYDPSAAFADAVQRARQIAAKINPQPGETNNVTSTTGTKRPLEETMERNSDGSPEAKKIAAVNDPFGAQLAAMAQQRNDSERKAKDMINQIVQRGADANQLNDGHLVVEMMIPGPKVGLVIGKGGETIRNLQERAGVKMVMIQDGPQQSAHEKPLRITGEPHKCEFAKRLVMDLITEKELESAQRGFNQNTNDYGTGEQATQEVMVPKQAVGVVIGKQGDMIKRIQQETGARVQFQQPHDENATERVCVLTGSPEQVHHAANFIGDLIQSVLARDQQNMGRGRGRGRGGQGFDGPGNFPPGQGMGRGGRRGPGGEDMQEIQYSVPANKCGLVIGKGGETIRQINQQSGAHVELSRNAPPNPAEKVFIIRGNPQQIEHAQSLINERIGAPPPPPNNQPPPSYPTQYPQPYQQPPPPNQGFAPQGWGNAYQHWQNQNVPPNDPTKAAADANAAAWAAYYAQYYGQQGGQPPQQQPPTAPANPGVPAQPAQPAPQGGPQPDYSQAWIEYYRSLGMYREAEMIEQQARANQSQQGGQFPQPNAAPNAAPAPGAQPGAVPTSTPQQPAQPQQQQPPTAPPAGQAPPGGQPPAGAPAPQGGQQYPPGQWPQGQYPPQQPQQQPPYGQPNAFAGYPYPGYGGQ